MEKITFSKLSIFLKIAIIFGWVFGILFTFYFVVGMIKAI